MFPQDRDGVKITYEEVEQAFKFFDVSGNGILSRSTLTLHTHTLFSYHSHTGVLRPRDLKARLNAFYPHMTNKEYSLAPSLTHSLTHLLTHALTHTLTQVPLLD